MKRDTTKVAPKRRDTVAGVDAQQRILETVDRLFYEEGARSVGVDAVARQSGLSKMALYRQFESKDALLLKYLERMDEVFWGHFESAVAQHPGRPKDQILQFFTDLELRSRSPHFRGCPFVNVAAEFPDSSHAARKMVAQTKARLMSRLLELATAAGAPQPRRLATGVALLIEGAYAASQTFAVRDNPIARVADVVALLLEAELGTDRRTRTPKRQ